MSEDVRVRLQQSQDYRFTVDFGGSVPPLVADEPAPLGAGAGPSPMQLLASAVGNCLTASLLFAFRKFKQAADPLSADVLARVGRNEANRLRVTGMSVQLRLGVPAESMQHLDRVLDSFESFCTVTQSVNQAFPVAVEVFDSTGRLLKGGDAAGAAQGARQAGPVIA